MYKSNIFITVTALLICICFFSTLCKKAVADGCCPNTKHEDDDGGIYNPTVVACAGANDCTISFTVDAGPPPTASFNIKCAGDEGYGCTSSYSEIQPHQEAGETAQNFEMYAEGFYLKGFLEGGNCCDPDDNNGAKCLLPEEDKSKRQCRTDYNSRTCPSPYSPPEPNENGCPTGKDLLDLAASWMSVSYID